MPTSKAAFHPNNIHQSGYNFSELCKQYPPLEELTFINNYGTTTLDFSNPKAVKKLNRALLFTYYNIRYWDFPDVHLCPPIPSRVEYMHHIADLLKNVNIASSYPVLDIGTGASCIYPLLGNAAYQWNFIGTDIDTSSLKHATKIVKKNNLDEVIQFRHQSNIRHVFKGILAPTDRFAATVCNPPFYSSAQEAQEANLRKQQGLGNNSRTRNFSGKNNELWYKGGEKAFIHTFLYESSLFKNQCYWYSTLVSKKENLKGIYNSLKKLGATTVKTIPMHQGNKITRIVAWSFISADVQKEWR